MTYKVTSDDLNQEHYQYGWSYEPEASTDGFNKADGNAVVDLIQRVYDYFEWEISRKVAQVEDHLHSHALENIASADELYNKLTEFTYK